MRDRQGQGAIRAGLDHQPAIGGGQRRVDVHVDRGHPGLRRLLAADIAPDLHVVVVGAERLEEAGAEHQEVVAVVVVVGAVRGVAVGELLGLDAAVRAHRAVADGDVGRAVELPERALQPGVGRPPAAAVEQGEPVRFAAVAQVVEPRGHRVQSLVPGDRHEARIDAAALLRVGPLHRSLEAVRVIEDVGAQGPLGAELAVGDGVVGIAVDGMHPAVGHVDVDAAAGGALVADVLDDPGLAGDGLRPGFGCGAGADPDPDAQCRGRSPARGGGREEASAAGIQDRGVHRSTSSLRLNGPTGCRTRSTVSKGCRGVARASARSRPSPSRARSGRPSSCRPRPRA